MKSLINTLLGLTVLILFISSAYSDRILAQNSQIFFQNIASHRYKGTWTVKSSLTQPLSEVHPLEHQTGKSIAYFDYYPETRTFDFQLYLYDGQYSNEDHISIDLNKYNHSLEIKDNKAIIDFGKSETKLVYTTHNKKNKLLIEEPFAKIEFIPGKGEVIARDTLIKKLQVLLKIYGICDSTYSQKKIQCLKSEYTVDLKLEDLKAGNVMIHFFFIMAVLGFKMACLYLLRKESLEETGTLKLSTGTIVLFLIWDYTYGFYPNPANLEIFSLSQRVLILFAEMVIIILEWMLAFITVNLDQFRYPKRIIICIFLFGLVLAGEYLPEIPVLNYILYLSLVPQIFKNVKQKDSIPYQGYKKLIYCCLPYCFTMYYAGIENNIAEYKTNFMAFAAIIVILIVQIQFLIRQDYKGPRFFIPQAIQDQIFKNYDDLRTETSTKTDLEITNINLSDDSPTVKLSEAEI